MPENNNNNPITIQSSTNDTSRSNASMQNNNITTNDSRNDQYSGNNSPNSNKCEDKSDNDSIEKTPSESTFIRRKEKIIELITVDGKKVSKTSKGKRKFHNKSKNGCANCKRRRVKCDEGKPTCQKCLNMKLQCVYLPVTARNKPKISQVETLPNPSIMTSNSTINSNEKIKSESDIKVKDNSSQNTIFPNKTSSTPQLSNTLPLKQENASSNLYSYLPRNNSNNYNSNGNVLTNHTSKSPTLLPQPIISNSSNGSNKSNNNSNGITTTTNVTSTATANTHQLNYNQDNLLPSKINLTTSIGSYFNNNSNLTTQNNSSNNPKTISTTIPTTRLNSNRSSSNTSRITKNSNVGSHEHIINHLMKKQQEQQSFMNTNNFGNNNGNTNTSNNLNALLSSFTKANINQSTIEKLINLASTFGSNPQMAQFIANNVNNINPNASNGISPIAGMGGIDYDFNELLGINNDKNSNANSNESSNTNSNVNSNANSNSNPDANPNANSNANSNQTFINQSLSQQYQNSTVPLSAQSQYQANQQIPLQQQQRQQQQLNTNTNTTTTTNTKNNSSNQILKLIQLSKQGNLNLIDLKLFHHYCTKVWPTIIEAGISGAEVWSKDIPELAFDYPFLMHSLLALSATHLSRSQTGLEAYVSTHRIDALRLLREAVLEISEDNTDALVASAIILIMDSLANASNPTSTGTPSAWIFHVKGAATILTAVWPLSEKSRFYNLISMDLSDLGDIFKEHKDDNIISELICFDDSISDLYPVDINSPYLITLAYLDKLYHEKNHADFILRIFAFPALLDKTFLALLMTGDLGAMRIMRSYYKLLRGYTTEVRDKVWFLEGVSHVLPQDVDEYRGGGGMHMMLDFLGGGLPSMTTTNLQEFM
ncbi:hypothetical protein TBLA_0H00680 [Henningerozyma blattae CBS 6284]|uniref:Zn(2)-C6 fungal-type domain-containing protein n=1 Tax=Henningerozyma blattae (strain ATCC 34711 / CBS 6284 / DSM 70876 / NBRC 10599 / NRRL Y-10934 / UCD 77-7) TaxID=1071380 RepID=I2H7K7_HENB6|nr:hypothetical protein TBLA_0H00680 [Tetrapisispora blattae CBS 6284]CCH62359.1 hypothetical protein TBLA_0H00680 [Tetrapisispora blattae CBS 6284]